MIANVAAVATLVAFGVVQVFWALIVSLNLCLRAIYDALSRVEAL